MKSSENKGRGRVVYVETDTMRGGTKRRSVITSRPKKGYSDMTTWTSKSGTVLTTSGKNILKLSVKSKGNTPSSSKPKASPSRKPKTSSSRKPKAK
jgi:hypothetical protein